MAAEPLVDGADGLLSVTFAGVTFAGVEFAGATGTIGASAAKFVLIALHLGLSSPPDPAAFSTAAASAFRLVRVAAAPTRSPAAIASQSFCASPANTPTGPSSGLGEP